LLGLSLIAAIAGQYAAAAILFVGFVLVSTYLKTQALNSEASRTHVSQTTDGNGTSSGMTASVPLVTGADVSEPANSDGGNAREKELDNSLIEDAANPDEFAFEWNHRIELERGQNRYRSWFATPDCDVIWDEVYDYRIEGTKVFHRLVESKEDCYGEVEYTVKDNVVLEREIRQRYPKQPVLAGCGVEQILESKRASVEWSEVLGRLKYFILSRHPEFLLPDEARHYFRQELQRLQCGFDAVMEKASEFGATLVDQELCKFRFPDGAYENLPKILSEESLRSYNISLADFTDGKSRILMLKRLLEDES
jgi:hypothetical protein